MSRIASFSLALLLSTWAAAADSKPPQSPVEAAIGAANQTLSSVYAKTDAAALAALYSEDGQVLPPDGEVVRGREAIQSFWQKMMKTGIPELHRKSLEIKSEGELAYEVGRYRLGGKSGRPVGQGKYIVIWKRDGEAWRLHRDIWNPTPPEKEK